MPAVSKGDGMRGLAVFISDIRNCKFVYFAPKTVIVSCWCLVDASGGPYFRGHVGEFTALLTASYEIIKVFMSLQWLAVQGVDLAAVWR
uniref:Uncharacterized protein n=1 Tax=Nothobranchius furzeri TaxID=105023 RepID=A0A8C6KW84_NOTFU